MRTERGLPTLPDSSSGGLLGRLAAYAMVILLLGGAAMVLARRYLPRFQPPGGGRIRVVAAACLGPRKQLHVVEVGSQRFLLASCRDSVTMISELAGSFSQALEASQAGAPTDGGGGGDSAGVGPTARDAAAGGQAEREARA